MLSLKHRKCANKRSEFISLNSDIIMETLIASLGAIAVALSVPIMILNSVGAIVAGIWLIIIGKWALVVSAILSSIISTWILSLLMAVTLLFTKPLLWATERKKHVLVLILGGLSNLWTYALMLFYGIGSFIFVFSYYEGGMRLPYLLLAYAVATAPWTYMASGEVRAGGGGAGTLIPVNGVCVAVIAMIIAVIFYGSSDITALTIACAIPLALAWIVQMIVVSVMLKEASKTATRNESNIY